MKNSMCKGLKIKSEELKVKIKSTTFQKTKKIKVIYIYSQTNKIKVS